MSLPRVLEPEVMDTAQEAVDYDTMDHSEVNRVFVDDLLAAAQLAGGSSTRVLDVGTGTAQIPLELCRRGVAVSIVAIDLAEEMLKVGRAHVAAAGYEPQIDLQRIDPKQLPYAAGAFDVVMTNRIVHTIPDPAVVIAEMVRVVRPGGWLFVRDLLRPDDESTVEQLVMTYAGESHARQQQLFRQSLHAALTVAEVQQMLRAVSMPADWCRQTTDRHWTICGQRPE